MIVGLTELLFPFLCMFVIAGWGILLNRRNLLLIYLSIELAFLSINLIFLIFSIFLDEISGKLFSLLILTVAAAESSLGLAILVAYYRYTGTVLLKYINKMKG